MKIIHVADLHIGKSMYGLSLLDSGDQTAWIESFVSLVEKEEPEAVLIAGDVYDRSNPSKEAIKAVDDLLFRLSGLSCKPAVMMIAGNHDSGPLVEYLSGIAKTQNIYLSGIVSKNLEKVTLEDEYGPVDFWLVPYVFPAIINQELGTDFTHYDEAFRAYIESQNIDYTRRNVIVAHQNITVLGKEADRGGSESMVGGIGGIDYTVFDNFEYAALGHIHAAQQVGRPEVRYAGSPLCYHFDELKRPKKGPVVVELGEKNTSPTIRIEEIKPLHNLREIRGTVEDIINQEKDNRATGEYIRVVLKPDKDGSIASYAMAADRLKALFKTHGSLLLDTDYEYARYNMPSLDVSGSDFKEKPINVQFAEFFEQRKGKPMDKDSISIVEMVSDQCINSTRLNADNYDKLSSNGKDDIDFIVNLAKSMRGDTDETC